MRTGNKVTYFETDGPDPGSSYGISGVLLEDGQRVLLQMMYEDSSPIGDTSVLVIIRGEMGERRLTATTDSDGNLVVEGLWKWSDSEVTVRLVDEFEETTVTISPSWEDTQVVEVVFPFIIGGN